MANRSTRKRIIYAVEQSAKSIDEALGSLTYAYELADGRSPYIAAGVPPIAITLHDVKELIAKMRRFL